MVFQDRILLKTDLFFRVSLTIADVFKIICFITRLNYLWSYWPATLLNKPWVRPQNFNKTRGRLRFGEMESCLLEYLVYYDYLVLCLSWYIFVWSEWKNLERQQRICSNTLRFTSSQFAKFKTVHLIEFRPHLSRFISGYLTNKAPFFPS